MKPNPNNQFQIKIGYKLFRQRANGTLAPLFIDVTLSIPLDTWLEAREDLKPPKASWKVRPGWHICHQPLAPHLTSTRVTRVWAKVEYREASELPRPERLGGNWILAKHIKVLGILTNDQVSDMNSGKSNAQCMLDRILS